MKFALVQMNVLQGQCEKNYQKMVSYIKQAEDAGVDGIIFPKNAISGYHLGDLWLDEDFCNQVDSYNEKLRELSDKIAIVYGNIKYRHHKVFDCGFFAYQKMIHMVSNKKDKDRFMDVHKYFDLSEIDSEIVFKNQKIKLHLGKETASDCLNINLDNDVYVKGETRNFANETIYVNMCGCENLAKNIMVYDGGSSYYKNGELMARLPYFEEGIQIIELGKKGEISCDATLLDALLFGVKCFDLNMGGKMPWIIGLSGGLDSSINVALLAMALGSERVKAYNMATLYNSDMTKGNAILEAKALGVELRNGSIEKLTKATIDVVCEEYGYDESQWPSLVKENIQARIRGHLLSTFAAIHGGVVVNNANKIEVALGYCTLYGDAIGAFSPLGDLTKCDLFEVGYEINRRMGKEVVPYSLLPEFIDGELHWEMPPSAELKDNQFDPMKWFYHDLLIEKLMNGMKVSDYLKMYLDQSIYESEFGKWIKFYHLDDSKAFLDDLKWVLKTMQRNGFKRLQTPPVMVFSKRSFGNECAEIQGNAEHLLIHELMEKIG